MSRGSSWGIQRGSSLRGGEDGRGGGKLEQSVEKKWSSRGGSGQDRGNVNVTKNTPMGKLFNLIVKSKNRIFSENTKMGSTHQQHRVRTGLFSSKMSVGNWRPRSSGKALGKKVKKRTSAFHLRLSLCGLLKFVLIGVILALSSTQGTMTSEGQNCYSMVITSGLFA
jgi:hypothetical protein